MRHLIDALKSGDLKSLFASFVYFDTGFSIWLLFGALAPFISHELKLTPLQSGFLVAVPVLSAAIFRLCFGYMYQYIDGKKIALMGIVLSSVPFIFSLAFPQELNYQILLLLGIFLGLGGASFAVALPMAGSNYPKEVQGLVLGLAAAGNIGAVLDGLIIPSLAKIFGWRNTISLAGLLLIPAFIIVLLLAKDRARKEGSSYYSIYSMLLFYATIGFMLLAVYSYHNWFGIYGPKALLAFPIIGSSFVIVFLPNKYKRVFLEKDTWIMILVYSITFGGFVGMASYISLYLVDMYGFTKLHAGLLMSLFAFTGAFIRPIGGYIADRISGVKALLFILFIISILYFIISFINLTPIFAVIFILVIFAFFGLGNGATFQLVPQRWPNASGLMSGIIGAAGGFGGFYLPTILGMVKQTTGNYSAGFLLFGIVSLVALIILKLVHSQWMEWAHVRYNSEKEAIIGIAPNGRVAMEFIYEVK